MSQIKLTFILFRMVRNYVCKTQCANWNEDQIRLAISAVEKNCRYERFKCLQGLNRRVNGRLKNLSFVVNVGQSQCLTRMDDLFTMQTMVSRRTLYCYRSQCDLCVCVCVTLNLKMI